MDKMIENLDTIQKKKKSIAPLKFLNITTSPTRENNIICLSKLNNFPNIQRAK